MRQITVLWLFLVLISFFVKRTKQAVDLNGYSEPRYHTQEMSCFISGPLLQVYTAMEYHHHDNQHVPKDRLQNQGRVAAEEEFGFGWKKTPFRTPLPSIMHGNVESIRNKTDELRACTQYIWVLTILLDLSETWFMEHDPDSVVELHGYSGHSSMRNIAILPILQLSTRSVLKILNSLLLTYGHTTCHRK